MPYRDAPPPSKANRFSERMTRATDAELIAIVDGDPDDWEQEALRAAHAEVAHRGIRGDDREKIREAVIDAKVQQRPQMLKRVAKTAAWVFFVSIAIYTWRHG